jgi:hypothetical protein
LHAGQLRLRAVSVSRANGQMGSDEIKR